jgi:hypothetical protein
MEKDWNEVVLKSISDGLEMLRTRQLYTDITICVEGASYRCHKAVLCLLSPYFDSMFSSNMRERQSEEVSLPFLDCKTFETLLDFFYSGKDVVTSANVEDVLQAASFMQIQCLQDRCVKVLCDTITEANCVRLWQLARLHNYSELEDTAWDWLMEGFTTVAKSTETFSSLDVDELVSVLEAEDLEADCESQVCDVALHWLAADVDLQKQYLMKVLGILKLSQTSSEYLSSVSTRYPFIERHEEANNLLMEVCKYHILPAETGDEQMCPEIVDTIVVIGDLEESNFNAVRCFSMSDHRWYKLPPVPYNIRGGAAAFCTYGSNKMYVSGGYDNPRKTAMYNADTNAWRMDATMNEGKCAHAMITVGELLYVLGGSDHNPSIERCSIEDGSYVRVGELQGLHQCLSAEVVDDNIILFSGFDEGLNVSIREVQCFNTATCTLTVLCDTQLIETCTWNIVCDEAILTITEAGSILKLIKAQDGTYECREIARMKTRPSLELCPCSVVAEKDGKMIILRDQLIDMPHTFEDLIVVKCDTGDVLWTVKMPFTVAYGRLVRLAIPREHLSDAL